jgi:hypothetical protein
MGSRRMQRKKQRNNRIYVRDKTEEEKRETVLEQELK